MLLWSNNEHVQEIHQIEPQKWICWELFLLPNCSLKWLHQFILQSVVYLVWESHWTHSEKSELKEAGWLSLLGARKGEGKSRKGWPQAHSLHAQNLSAQRMCMGQMWATIRQPVWDHLRSCLRGLGRRTSRLQYRQPDNIIKFLWAEKGELHLLCQRNPGWVLYWWWSCKGTQKNAHKNQLSHCIDNVS